jgi:NAD+ synthase (glutamine-hydrolysing)
VVDSLRIALAQMNPTVGDLHGNVDKAIDALGDAERRGADLVVFPEMMIPGYPVEDLLFKPGFLADVRVQLDRFAAATSTVAAVIGFCDGQDTAWNTLALCADGEVKGTYHKRHLPNYEVFDELRHFRAGQDPLNLFEIAGIPVGVTICEDSWVDDGPVCQLGQGGARLILNVNGSPFRIGKQELRESIIARRVNETGVPVVYANLVGGQDELVFDGGSFVVTPTAEGPELVARCCSFVEDLTVFDLEIPAGPEVNERFPLVPVTGVGVGHDERIEPPLVDRLGRLEEIWLALVTATRDYVRKSGFTKVCLGLSGGVDSALVAAIAADALGAENVVGVLMPSRYSSDHSVSDARALAANLGIATRTVEIEPAHAALVGVVGPTLSDGRVDPGDLTDQNLQSRIRGTILMATANEHGWLVLTTGNKSEAAVGYSTLYGDTAGAYAVIRDLWKLVVYELCAWRNARDAVEVIPATILTKPPSAELRPDQRDDQSLPAYEILDPILQAYVERDMTVTQIVASGEVDADVETVQRICHLVDVAEFKRRQTPVGPRLTGKAFGRDRRMPIVNRYRG